jgi:hypothetical protein
MNIAEQKSIEKIWIVLQEIQEKREILQNDDEIIDFPKEPSGFYLKALLMIEGGEMRRSAILNARAEIIRGLAKREVIDIEEEMFNTIRFTITEKFDDFYKEIEKKYNAINKTEGTKVEIEPQLKEKIPRKDNLLLTKSLKASITIGKLSAYNDGTIRYGKNIIKMRNQIKDLCRLFMEHPNRLLTIDDIKNEIIRADRRTLISFRTIAKYVSELRNSLKIHFGQDVIFNQKEEGWFFKPPK